MYVCVWAGRERQRRPDAHGHRVPRKRLQVSSLGKSALSIRNLNDAMYVCMYVLRLGACEAPPAIVSVYLGDDMTQYLESFMSKRP